MAQVKADRRLREQHASLLANSKATREQAAAQAARATALEEELAQLNAKACDCPCSSYTRFEAAVVGAACRMCSSYVSPDSLPCSCARLCLLSS